LASNVLGIAAGGAALAGAARNPALRGPTAQNAGPVTGKLVHRGGVLNGRGRTLVRAGAGAAIGLQTANLVGDLVTNRVLSREAKKGDSVAKSVEQSIVSKSSQVRVTGRGVNIEKSEKAVAKRYYDPEMDRQRRLGMYAGAGIGGGAGLIAMGASGVKPSSREVEGGRVVRGLSMPKGKKARGKLALLAAGLASTGGGIAAYKHSNSRENDPWD
jgi:hypothetical protein